MKAITVKMFHESEKKNSHRYDACDQTGDPAITAMYIKKTGMDGPPPKFINVTIVEAE